MRARGPRGPAYLLVVEGQFPGQRYDLGASTTIGRQSGNAFQIIEPQVSKFHCSIELGDEGYVLRDAGSMNGTFINGVRIAAGHTLRSGETIGVGTTRLRFEEEPSKSWSSGYAPSVLARPQALPSGGPAYQPGPPPPAAMPPAAQMPQAGFDEAGRVKISSVCPERVAPGASFLVDVVLHLSSFDLEVGSGFAVDRDLATLRLRPGAELEVRVCLDEDQAALFRVDEERARVLWQPPYSRVSFRLRVDSGAIDQATHVRVEIAAAEVHLCHFYVELRIAQEAPPVPRKVYSVVRKLPQTAFASYASVDRDAVCTRLQGVEALGLDVFLDCLDIRAGADWQRVLAEAVIAKDVFLLFWSTAASCSPWVTKEWQAALAARGLEYISPSALEPPHLCPPPDALASLHFGSRFLRPV